MKSATAGSTGATAPEFVPEIAAEAAVWIARLHGPDRSARMERECLDWQSRSAAHRLAFERCTEVWQAVPQLSLADAYSGAAAHRAQERAPVRRPPRHWTWAGLLLGTLVAGVGWYVARVMPDYVTGVGEQRSVVLADGSLLSMNTSTRVDVAMTASKRSVRVDSGEALFEVAKDANRPFVVHASGSEVVALGTAFTVRLSDPSARDPSARDPSARNRAALAVTLIEGKVSVRPSSEAPGPGGVAPPQEVQLAPGDRVSLVESAKPAGVSAQVEQVETIRAVMTLDRPRMDQITAWKRSEVIFDDVSLQEAVGEMNRYNRVPIVLPADAALSRLRVSGSFRAGDSDGFARAAATLHGLVMRRHDGRLELLRPQ